MKKVLKIIGIVFLVIIVIILILFLILSKRPAVPTDYIKTTKTNGEIESRYMAKGDYDVSYIENMAMSSFKKYEIYYPACMTESTEKFPVVIFVNGTGVKASKYPALMEHLASYGFICIGTEEEYAWNGFAAEMCVRLINKLNDNESLEGYNDKETGTNPFYNHIDLNNVGITGHSQGGVGVANAVTVMEHKDIFKTAVMLSPTNKTLATALEWDYNPSLITIPIFLMSSTGQSDENLVVNLKGMEEIYNSIPDSVTKVMARRNDADHGYMLYYADGYVTAWFCWQLQGDEEASKAFVGDTPELITNSLYQDQHFNIK